MHQNDNKSTLNELLMIEIHQYHSVVKDFSNQSLSIKKLSITIYIAFLSLFFTVVNNTLSQLSFFVIGLSISTFCYVYEIYVDYIRQKTRRRMESKIIEYERTNGLTTRKNKKIVVKFFCLELCKNDNGKLKLGFKRSNKFEKFYVNIAHCMYIIYLIEMVVTILIGVIEF